VLRLLAKHFRKYIKEFREDQFKLSLSKGTAELKDLQLREDSLEDLLLLPSGVGITSAACSNLLVKIPSVTKIKKIPSIVRAQSISIVLEQLSEEQQQVRADKRAAATVAERHSSSSSSSSSANDFFQHMVIEVEHLTLTLQTQEYGALTFTMSHLRSCSTSPDWKEVTDLSKLPPSIAGMTIMHKHISCKATSLYVTAPGDQAFAIFSNLPAELQVKAVLDEDAHTSSKIRVQLLLSAQPLEIKCNQYQANAIMGILQAVLLCFQKPPSESLEEAERPTPQPSSASSIDVPTTAEEKNSSGFDVSYNLLLGKWSFVVEPNEVRVPALETVTVSGSGLNVRIVPLHRSDSSCSVYQSSVLVSLRDPSLWVIHSPERTIQLIGDTPATETAGSGSLLDIVFSYRHSVETGEDGKRSRRPLSVSAEVSVGAATLCTHRGAWSTVTNAFAGLFGSAHVKTISKITSEHKASGAAKAKQLLGKVSENDLIQWLAATHVTIQLTNATLIMPLHQAWERNALEQLVITLQKLVLTNVVSWKDDVPWLREVLAKHPHGAGVYPRCETGKHDHRLQAELCGASASIMSGEARGCLFAPADFRLFVRLGTVEQTGQEEALPFSDIALHSSKLHLSINPTQEKWLKAFALEYRAWIQSLQLSPEQREKALQTVLEQSEKAKTLLLEKATAEVLDAVPSAAVGSKEESATAAKAERAREIAVAVEQSLKSFRGAIVYRVDAGKFSIAIGDKKKADSEETPLSTVAFEGLQAFVSNTSALQSVHLSLDTVDLIGLPHPSAAASLEFHAREEQFWKELSDAKDRASFVLAFTRPSLGKGSSRAQLALRGLKLSTQLHETATGSDETASSSVSALPDFHQLGDMLANKVLAERENFGKYADLATEGIQHAKSGESYLDTRWSISIGECLFEHIDASGQTRVLLDVGGVDASIHKNFTTMSENFAQMKLESVQQAAAREELENTNGELMEQLVKAKMELAQLRADMDSR